MPPPAPQQKLRLAILWRLHHFGIARQHFARCIVGSAIAAEVTGIVVHHLLFTAVNGRQLRLIAGQQFRVMFDLEGLAVFLPVRADGANAVRTDGEQLGLDVLLHVLDAAFGQL